MIFGKAKSQNHDSYFSHFKINIQKNQYQIFALLKAQIQKRQLQKS